MSVIERKCGKTPSSIPTMNTTGNSRPFAMCRVISVTVDSSSSYSSCSPTSETCSRNSARPRVGVARRGLHRHAGELLDVLDPTLRLDRALLLELQRGSPTPARRTPPSAPGRRRRRRCACSAAITWLNPATAPFARACEHRDLVDAPARLDDVDAPRRGRSASSAATVASPIPRFGVFTTRRNEITSCGLSSSRR